MFKMFSKLSFFGSLMISAACAQSGQPMQARIPFAFTVTDTTLPPGNYQFTYGSSAQRLTIRSRDGNSATIFATAFQTVASEPSSDQGRLIFNCYSHACYLAQLNGGSLAGNRGVQVLGSERRRTLSISARTVAITIPTN
jgi:YD repeat-containing protein